MLISWITRTYTAPWVPPARWLLKWALIGQALGVTFYVVATILAD